MPKLTLVDLENLENQSSAVSLINANNALIEEAVERTLTRDGTSPNTMVADLDMNSNRILNLPEPVASTEPLRKTDVSDATITVLTGLKEDAEAAAEAAEASETAAALSETNSATHETNAETAETNAESAQAAAEAAQLAAETALDEFTDIYLGSFASDPTLDNDGDALVEGQFYNNTVTNRLRFYLNSVWVEFVPGDFELVNDTTPQLGGDLDLNGHTITGLVIGTNVQAYDADLTTWAGVTSSSNGRSLVSAADYAAMRALLDLEAGTDFYSIAAANAAFQAKDADLTAIAGLTSAANKGIMFTGSGTAGTYDLTAAGLALLDDAAATNQLTTLGLTANGKSLVTAADYAAMKALLDLEIGTDVLAYDAQLTSNVRQNSKSTDYTLVLTDAAKHILHPASDDNARTFTIPANSSVAFPIGTVIVFINEINTLSIGITSDTLIFAGDGDVGTRHIAADGMAMAIKTGTTKWYISGAGLS